MPDRHQKPKQPAVPAMRHETDRQAILAVLEEAGDEPLSAKDISGQVGLPEKDVYAHLEHVRTSSRSHEHRLKVVPAECKKCGFVFGKRDRLTRPGKCPVCRGQQIEPPRFALE